jgi:hypothetical protein
MHKLILAASGLAFLSMCALPSLAQGTMTAKERSSRKWFDEQRVDNCRVPVDLRGTTPRPGCRDESAVAQGTPPLSR